MAPAKPLPIVFEVVSTNLTSLNISRPNSLPSLYNSVSLTLN